MAVSEDTVIRCTALLAAALDLKERPRPRTEPETPTGVVIWTAEIYERWLRRPTPRPR